MAGALEPLGRAGEPPTPPINVLGDFAGGGLMVAFAVAAAAYEREQSGEGQVVDVAMVDGAALLLTPFYGGRASGGWGERGTNSLDTGAHFYEVYETADGAHVAVGAIEPQFYAALLRGLGLENDPDLAAQWDRDRWDANKARLAAAFRTRTRDEWCAVFEGTDACVAPVLTPVEAPSHPHNVARAGFVELAGVPSPAPAPRFGRTPAGRPSPPHHPGADGDEALADWGLAAEEIAALRDVGAIA